MSPNRVDAGLERKNCRLPFFPSWCIILFQYLVPCLCCLCENAFIYLFRFFFLSPLLCVALVCFILLCSTLLCSTPPYSTLFRSCPSDSEIKQHSTSMFVYLHSRHKIMSECSGGFFSGGAAVDWAWTGLDGTGLDWREVFFWGGGK